VHVLGRRTVAAWRIVARDAAVAVAVTGGLGLVAPGHFGWVTTVSKQFAEHTPFSVAGAVGGVLTPIVQGASYDDVAAGARITAIIAAVCVIGYLIATARHRALDRTVGYALLALGLLAPVLHPWYLLWGLICLAPTATGPRRVAILILSAAGCLITPPGFSAPVGDAISGVVVGLAAASAAGLLLAERRRAPSGAAAPVSVGR
jgi:alpha-1,6-mannosyltransferase